MLAYWSSPGGSGSSLTNTDGLPEGSTNLYYTNERVDDEVNNLLVQGTGIMLSYNDIANTLTISCTVPTYTDEQAQDAVGTILTDSATIDFTYNDAGNTITAIVIDNSITNAKLAQMPTLTIKGNNTGGTANALDLTASQVLTLLSISGTNTGDQLIFQTIACPAGTNPVADTTADTLTLTAGTGLVITGTAGTDTIAFTLNLGAIDHNSLNNLATGDVHTQYTKDPGTVVDKEITIWSGTGGRDFATSSGIGIGLSTSLQITPTAANTNLLIDGNGTGFVQLNTGSNSQQFPKIRPTGSPAGGYYLSISTVTGLMVWNTPFGAVATDQLQTAYNSTTGEPLFQLNASFPFYIYDNATPLATAFKVANSTGATSYFDVDSTGAATIKLDVDNLTLNGNTVSSTDTNGNILLSPNGTGTVIVGTSVGENNLLINQLGLMGSGISANAMVNVNTTSTLRNALSFTVTSQNTGTAAAAIIASTTDQGTNATHAYSSVNASITLDTTSHTTYTQTVLVAAGGTAAARTFSAGTYTFHGLRVRPTVNGTGGTHSGGTVRIYGILQEAIGTYASVGSQLSMGAFFNDSINVPADTKIIWDSTSTALGDTYHVYNSATTDMDVYVDNTRTFTFDADKNISHTNLKLDTANTGLFLKEGTNCCMGVSTLVGGTIVVNTTMAVTGVRIFLSRFTNGGTLGTLSYTITTGTSFTINSSNILDTSVVNWLIISQG